MKDLIGKKKEIQIFKSYIYIYIYKDNQLIYIYIYVCI